MNGTGLPDRSLGPRSSSRHHSLPPSHNNDIYNDTRHPQGLPFLGPLPSSNAYAERAFDGWNVSPEGCFPLQPLRGPGQFGDPLPSTARQPFPPTSDPIPPAPHHHLPAAPSKRKRIASPEPATVGGYGPISDGKSDQEADRMAVDPSPTVKFGGRKGTAHDIWAFVRAIESNEPVPFEQWPDDYNEHLSKKPKTTYVGCKFCTQFG